MKLPSIIQDLESVTERLKELHGEEKALRAQHKRKSGRNQKFLMSKNVGDSWVVPSRSKMIACRESATDLGFKITTSKNDDNSYSVTLISKP